LQGKEIKEINKREIDNRKTDKRNDMIIVVTKGMMPEIFIEIEDYTKDIAITFPTTSAIGNGEDGMNGIVTTAVTPINTEEDIITMTTAETWYLPTVKTTEIVPPVSHSEFISKLPCYKCLVFVMCKQKVKGSVVGFAHHSGCPQAYEFVLGADQDSINNMRQLFGLEPYP